MKKSAILTFNLLMSAALLAGGEPPKPEKCHLDQLDEGIMAIIHFGLNTFCDKEWGYGDTPPSVFNPTKLNTDQWVEAMAAAEIKRVVMVTKHHDGFNLWPSPLNKDYTVANSPWKGGKGDVVGEIHDSCIKKGLKFGVYLSPWDRHQAFYARPEYVEYYHAQFDELFDKYGPITEIWLDGANGGDGWYGGAKETRKLPVSANEYYQMGRLIKTMISRYPDAIAFGGAGAHSSNWVGNELGFAPETMWCESWGVWQTPECDTPLRPGWFWHPNEAPKSLAKLVEIYFASVGRGCVLNLGIAPNREGLVGNDDVKRLKEFGDYVRAFNAVDYAKGAKVNRTNKTYSMKLKGAAKVNCVDIREDVTNGQRIAAWKFEAKVGGKWKELVKGTTAGYRRLERFEEVTAGEFRLTITETRGEGARVNGIALRYAKKVPEDKNDRIGPVEIPAWGTYYTVDKAAPADEFIANFKQKMTVKAIRFSPKRNNGVLVDRYAVSYTADGEKWQELKSGEFGNIKANPVEQWINFEKPLEVLKVRVKALHAVDDAAPAWNRNDQNCVLFY